MPDGSIQRIAVLGDLHYELPQDQDYRAARGQILSYRPDAVVQLGDQGGYSHCGTWLSFQEGLDFLRGFDLPWYTLIGNHDMEGPAYRTDAEAVAAWCAAFEKPSPYYTMDLGETLGICLSSTRFRASPASPHEVHIDDQQIAWLEKTLAANPLRPTFIFAHVPILGSGLRILQNVHLKCPNAWLNHTDQPERFIGIVRQHPQVKLWFSAHNHLGQMYTDSISQVGNCSFVHTGVIGNVTRDDFRHSRLIDFNDRGFTISTIDHATGTLFGNLRHDYRANTFEQISEVYVPENPLYFPPPRCPTHADRLQNDLSVFAIHRGMLVEFDRTLASPIGVVLEGLADEEVQIRDGVLRIVDRHGKSTQLHPNAQGRYLHIFTPNTWHDQVLSA